MTERENPASPKPRKARTISLGAAILAIPAGAVWLYNDLSDSTEKRNRQIEEGARYDLAALRAIDPALLRFEMAGQIHPGMELPRAIAVDSGGRILVAGDERIRILAADGQAVGEIALGRRPTCLAGNERGEVLVGLTDHVERFSADGKRLGAWPAFSSDSVLTGIAVAGNDIYVADSGRRVVYRCSTDGQVQAELGRADPSRGIPGLLVPSPHLQVAVAPDGLVWVNNPGRHRLEAYDRNGELERFFGSAGTAIAQFLGCCNPTSFAIGSDGRIVTAEKGIPRVKAYLPDGRLDSVVAGPDAFGDNVVGLELAVDSSGHVLILEPGVRDIRVYRRSS